MLLFLASGAALGALLGRSWPLLAPLGPSRGAPGSHFRHRGASVGSFSGLFFRRRWKNTKTLIFDDSCSENQGLGVPGESQIDPRWLPNRSWARLDASWRSLGASRRCLGVSWRPLGAPGASWAPLGPLLKRFWLKRKTWLSWNGKRAQSESCKHGKKSKSSESSKNRESQSASTMRRSSARAARPARASKRHSNTTAYALAQPLRGLAGRGAHCSAAKAASLAR